jgi:hypothetical protein
MNPEVKNATPAPIDLTALSNAHHAGIRESKRNKAIAYVDGTILPYLTNVAKAGNRMAIVHVAEGLYADDIIDEILNRTTAKSAKRLFAGSAKIRVEW